ncbi:MAG: HAD family hydrolase [Dechloromonas sp.]|nr:HAD family hydrolase [Dechloromonas sp.]
MNSLHALIFDVDGTLAETERDGHRPAFNAAFAECGLAWTWDEAAYGELLRITGGKERIRHYAAQVAPARMQEADFAEFVQSLHHTKTRHYLQRVAHGQLPLRPGVVQLIHDARQAGLRLAIATTTSPDNVDALLRATLGNNASSWFEVIGAGDIVAAKKPAPDIYQWVLDRLALPASACLAIEDSEMGLKAALTAGLRCLVTVSEYTQSHDFSGALRVVDDLSQVTLADLAAATISTTANTATGSTSTATDTAK